ncbi:hypothetical protein BDF19DRAFT_434376 [Syncephalis fuscata]|nr:hypothetical protein BDF19DRAFT_434376 [Syncephalis fuscata]
MVSARVLVVFPLPQAAQAILEKHAKDYNWELVQCKGQMAMSEEEVAEAAPPGVVGLLCDVFNSVDKKLIELAGTGLKV